jgi:hypothetical protein
MIGGEELEKAVADGWILFIEDRIRSAVDQDFWRDHAGEGDYFSVGGLLEDFAADFG